MHIISETYIIKLKEILQQLEDDTKQIYEFRIIKRDKGNVFNIANKFKISNLDDLIHTDEYLMTISKMNVSEKYNDILMNILKELEKETEDIYECEILRHDKENIAHIGDKYTVGEFKSRKINTTIDEEGFKIIKDKYGRDMKPFDGSQYENMEQFQNTISKHFKQYNNGSLFYLIINTDGHIYIDMNSFRTKEIKIGSYKCILE